MRKCVSLMMVCVMALMLCACGSKPQETTAAPAETKSTEAVSNETGSTDMQGELPQKPADFPTSTITCVVGFTAGGGVDTAARLLLKYAQNYIDVPIVVTNVTGAAGAVAVTQALNGKADGTTLISIASGALLGVYRSDDSRFTSPEQFVEYVKAHPNELTVATSGVNNANYFATKSFFEDNGMSVEIVPFNGSADAKSGFLGGHVDLFCETLLETVQMSNDGSAKFVCTFGDEPYVEGVKTNKDLGIEMSVTGTFRGYAYKAGTSQEVIDYLAAIFELCEKDPGFIEECKMLGLDKCINYLNPADATDFMKNQYDSYTDFCKQLGIAK